MATNREVKLSNVIGAPFAYYVLEQLANRAYRSSTGTTKLGNRTNEEVLYLANKTAWVRVVSSVDIVLPPGSNTVSVNDFVDKLGIKGSGITTTANDPAYNASNSLAKNWILQAGTSVQNGNGTSLRSGLGPNGAYGMGGTQELGYRPMPGLSSVTIETTGRLGSLRQATVNFKVWNMNQLNTIEALYFRLGYSMLLEWGHTQYFANQQGTVVAPGGIFVPKDIYGIDDPFNPDLWVEDIQRKITIKRESTSGNYDGMLGIVTNFTWSQNQSGGYDCTLRLVGQGAVMDSMRVNQIYKLPAGAVKQYKGAESAQDAYIAAQLALLKKQNEDLAKQIAAAGAGPTGPGTGSLGPVPDTPQKLLEVEKAYDDYTGNNFNGEYGVFSTRNFANGSLNTIDYVGIVKNSTDVVVQGAQIKYSGLYLNRSGKLSQIATKDSSRPAEFTFDSTVFQSFNGKAETADWGDRNVLGSPDTKLVSDLSTQGLGITKLIDVASEYHVIETTTPTSLTREVTFVGGPDKLPAPVGTNVLGLKSPSQTLTKREFVVEDIPTVQGTTLTERYFEIDYRNPVVTDDFQPSRQELIDAVDRWASNNGKGTITDVSFTKGSGDVVIEGNFTVTIYSSYKGSRSIDAAGLKALPGIGPRLVVDPTNNTRVVLEVPLFISFKTDEPGFLNSVSVTPPPPPPAADAAGIGDSGTSGTTIGKVSSDQEDPSMGFSSALHAMLTVVQSTSQAEALKKKDRWVSITLPTTTGYFYQDGIFKDIVVGQPAYNPQTDGFKLTTFAQKGFATELLADYTKFDSIPWIGGSTNPANNRLDFTNFFKSLVFKFKQNNVDGIIYPAQFPVYISLGYLLSFLNNMCLFYNSKTDPSNQNQTGGNDTRPYIYIDFNPETNFCLTSPYQFSIDPLICLIPANLSIDQYKEIFPKDAVPPSGSLFDPQGQNKTSDFIVKEGFGFKAANEQYRGKVMNILITTQYLLRILKDFTTADPDHAVNLHPFLERIMRDINKCLGGMNLFRVAYRDDTNSIQIVDDQFVPPLESETTVLKRDVFINNLKTTALSGQLPIFGATVPGPNGTQIEIPSLGIARDMQMRTVTSTKLASMIAISAQSYTGSVNAKDHSEFSYLNSTYRDRYKPFIKDQTNGANGNNTNTVPTPTVKGTSTGISNDKLAAERFNEHVKTIYTNLDLVTEKIDSARNYYIERISKVKSDNPATTGAPFIPVELELTLDGISGIIMGNAFTIPKERLPLTLRREVSANTPDGFAKVGFIVNGLTHNIENNQWTTKIKGQMIKLRESTTVLGQAAVNPTGAQAGATTLRGAAGSGSGEASTNRDRNDPNSPCYVPPFVLQAGRTDTLPAAGKKRDGILAWRAAVPASASKGIKAFLEAQTIHEGFYAAEGGKPASKSWRTNNPGNIGNTDDGTINQLPSLSAGVVLQFEHLQRVINGSNSNYPRDPSLYEYISRYAPPCYRPDRVNNPNVYVRGTNNPISYTNAIIAYMKGEYGLSITADMTLSKIVSLN